VEGIDPELLRTRWLGGSSMAATAVTRLVGAMSAMTAPVGLVLDHVELVSNQDCRDAIAELALLGRPRGTRPTATPNWPSTMRERPVTPTGSGDWSWR
jgi:hypothetical protein